MALFKELKLLKCICKRALEKRVESVCR